MAINHFHNKRYLATMSNPMQVKEANQPKFRDNKGRRNSRPKVASIGTIGQTTYFSAPARGIYKISNNAQLGQLLPMGMYQPMQYYDMPPQPQPEMQWTNNQWPPINRAPSAGGFKVHLLTLLRPIAIYSILLRLEESVWRMHRVGGWLREEASRS